MSATLAIKPTRREIIKAVLDAAKAKKTQEALAVERKWRELHNAAGKANERIQEIARSYANKKYKNLLTKLRKLILADFPQAQVNFTVDLEKVQDSTRGGGYRERFKPDGKAQVRLAVWDSEKPELDLPQEVREQMAAAKDESERLYKESAEVYEEVQRLRAIAGEYGHHDNTAYQKLLERVVPALGEDAAPHLDALIAMVEKALTPVNETATA